MLGLPLRESIDSDAPIRPAALFGHFGGDINVTDGRYVYLRKGVYENICPFHYTLFPTVMRGFLPHDVLRTGDMVGPLPFTKASPVVRFGHNWPDKLTPCANVKHELYDLLEDPQQQRPLDNAAIERQMIEHLVRTMKQTNAPAEQFTRVGL